MMNDSTAASASTVTTFTAHCFHAAIGSSTCHSSVPISRSSALASDPISSASSPPYKIATTGTGNPRKPGMIRVDAAIPIQISVHTPVAANVIS